MFNTALLFNPSDGTSKRFSVPVVQELASQNLQSLPERYIRSEKERPNAFPPHHSDIPIIDMDILLKDSDLRRQKELEKLGIACQQWGFFQAVNHGIPLSLLDRMKGIMREFIQLPLEAKLKYKMQEIEGYGQAFVTSDDQILDWADIKVISNGIYKSIEHRAVTNMDRDRISIATFCGPSMKTEVGPVPELIDELHPCLYRRFNRAEYMQNFFSGKLEGKKIDFAKIKS
ncbi:protein SRG1 isoform X1 [Cryptomeria japonica]|uniref:protein SRG1 isoform X1 n=1 Tax=Cryptomeria japonica TaxID=3369 RepID=UPI0027DA5321|nr:protein SRG1 isoform X1 [Cryptomeria japonica]